LLEGGSSWFLLPEVARNRTGPSTPEAWQSGGQLRLRAEWFDAGAVRTRRLTRHARHQQNHRNRHQSCRGESSFEWSSGGSSARGGEGEAFEYLGLRIRRLPLGFDSRRSVESGELPFGPYRPMHAGGWSGAGMPCAFRALQLQRFESRMFRGAARKQSIGRLRRTRAPVRAIPTATQAPSWGFVRPTRGRGVTDGAGRFRRSGGITIET
jgi:hypothetical protein